jgi:hypothetical protein
MGESAEEKTVWQKIQYWFYYGMFKLADKFPSLMNVMA